LYKLRYKVLKITTIHGRVTSLLSVSSTLSGALSNVLVCSSTLNDTMLLNESTENNVEEGRGLF
jgi:hypothetical protein